MREVARQHPWEFFLLFTIPVVFGAVRMTLAFFEAPAWTGFGVNIVYLFVLIATFPFVRRSGKQLLTLLWLILILNTVYRRVLIAIQNPPGFERTDNLTIVRIAVDIQDGLTYFVLTANMVGYVVLAVVFMLAAARLGGLRYAFLLLGLLGLEQNFSFSSTLLSASRYDYVPLWYFAPMSLHLLAQVGINVLMFRALTRLDTRAFTSITLIVGSLLLALASDALWAAIVFWPLNVGLPPGHPYISLSLLAVRATHIVGQTLAIIVLALVLHCALRRPTATRAPYADAP